MVFQLLITVILGHPRIIIRNEFGLWYREAVLVSACYVIEQFDGTIGADEVEPAVAFHGEFLLPLRFNFYQQAGITGNVGRKQTGP
jgi:hypothetical protein